MRHRNVDGSARGNRLRRLIELARAHGKGHAAYLIASRVRAAGPWRNGLKFCVSNILEVAVADLTLHDRIPRAFTVRPATQIDLPALRSYVADAARVDARFERGDSCIITLASGQVCAALWLACGPAVFSEDVGALGCKIRVPRGTCLTYDGRGTKWGAWGSLMGRLPRFLHERKIDRIFTLIDPDNRESLDSHRSLGYQVAGRVAHFGTSRRTISLYCSSGDSWRRLPGSIGRLEFRRETDILACE